MEQDLNNIKNSNIESIDSFKVEYKGQDVSKLPEFKRWYEINYQYVKDENKRRNNPEIEGSKTILTIAFCNNCLSYAICYYAGGLCTFKCYECDYCFCIGCLREQSRSDFYEPYDSTCLTGFLKGLYLRTIYRRSDLVLTSSVFHIICILFFAFFSLLYI